MNKFKVVAFALLAMFVFTGCSVKNNSDVIKINDTVITKSEYEKAYDSVVSGKMFEQMGIDLKKDPDNIFALMIQWRLTKGSKTARWSKSPKGVSVRIVGCNPPT